MRFEVVFHVEARREAINAARYIAEHTDRQIALRWYEGLDSLIDRLTEMPRRCPHARENDAFPNVELRQLAYESHRIIFSVQAGFVHILHIRHHAQRNLEEI